MIYSVGDVVIFHSDEAGKHKYHLVVCGVDEQNHIHFLYLNRKAWEADLILPDGSIQGLPKSTTDQTAICCSKLISMHSAELLAKNPRVISKINTDVSRQLHSQIKHGIALSVSDQRIALNGLSKII